MWPRACRAWSRPCLGSGLRPRQLWRCPLGVGRANAGAARHTAGPAVAPGIEEEKEVADRLERLEEALVGLRRSLDQNKKLIDRNYEAYNETKRLWKPETMERMHDNILRIEQRFEHRLSNIGKLSVRGRKVFTRRTVGILTFIAMVAILARSLIYKKMAAESAALGKEVLDENMQNIVDTIKAVSKDPETLAALVSLLTQLIQDETTRRQLLALVLYLVQDEGTLSALLALLMDLFKDEALTQRVGEFLLNSLNTETTRQMLNEQTQALVSATVLDRQVQLDAGTGIRRAVRSAVVG